MMSRSERKASRVNVLLQSFLLEIDERKHDWVEVSVWVVTSARLASRPCDIAVVKKKKTVALNSCANSNLISLQLPDTITVLIILTVLTVWIWSDLQQKHAEVLEVHKILKELILFRG